MSRQARQTSEDNTSRSAPAKTKTYITIWKPIERIQVGDFIVKSTRNKDWRDFIDGMMVPSVARQKVEAINYRYFRSGKRFGQLKYVLLNKTGRYFPNTRIPVAVEADLRELHPYAAS